MNRRRFFGCFAAMAAAPALVGATAPVAPVALAPPIGILNSFNVGTGCRADMLDIVTNISPMDTLYMSGWKQVPATKNHEWLVDTLASFGEKVA